MVYRTRNRKQLGRKCYSCMILPQNIKIFLFLSVFCKVSLVCVVLHLSWVSWIINYWYVLNILSAGSVNSWYSTQQLVLSTVSCLVTTSLIHLSDLTGCRSQHTYSTNSLFWHRRTYMEAHHFTLVRSSVPLIYLVDGTRSYMEAHHFTLVCSSVSLIYLVDGTRSYMEAHHFTLVHSSVPLIYLVDEHCVLLAATDLLCHQSNCLQSAVEPSWSPLSNCGTAYWRHHSGWFTVEPSASTQTLSVAAVRARCCSV